MSGKAYTMREMKSIVEYLVEQKAYSETKGRKMWVTFASSKFTTRTWQSLKETFLKRILPDIQNPYYKLTIEQVRSFKEGHDVEARSNNKLELQTVSEESTSNGQKETNGEKPTSTEKEVDLPSGEDIKSAPISRNRSSVDTLVLEDPYYSNAEEIQNVLENTTESDINEELYKPLKDCLTFEQSEPFNIDAMKVLEDFATDSEGSDKGLRMDIDENPPNTNNKETEAESEDPIVIQDTEDTQEVTNNPIEAEVNVMVFGKETEDSNDKLPAQITDKDEAVPDKNQTDTDHNDTKIQQPNIINDQPVVISDQSDTNNDEDDNIMETEADVSNPNNDTSEVLLSYDTSDVNNEQAEKTETIEDKQNKVVDKIDQEKVVQKVTPIPEKKSPSKPKSPETVQTEDIAVSDMEKTEKTPESPKKVRISEPLPNSNVTVNTSSNITDSLIPNNQEALNETDTQTKLEVTQEKVKKSRKRSSSHESECNKKIKLDETVVKNKETQPENNEKTDMRKMESEDLFAHVDSHQNKETDKTIENKVTVNELNEDFENNEAENNPCLKSVSLFAEQFNTTKLLDSESEDENVEQSNSLPKEPENYSKQSDNNSKVPANSSKQSDNNSKDPANSSKQSDNISEDLSYSSKRSDNDSKNPANSSKQPDNKSKEPGITFKQPDNKPKEPATTSKQSVYNSKEPASTSKQSDNNSNEPVNTSKQSDNVSTEPANTSKQSDKISDSRKEFSKDTILLKSYSESDDNKHKASVSNAQKSEKVKDKVRKESALANMLGFGGIVSRKRRISHRRSRTNRHSFTKASDSSEWTSESDEEEYVSPPRGRRNRPTRKYLKPKSAKILSLNEEGGLFVMHGKKIYPLVKDGRYVKNYLSYHIESDSEEEEHSYWRQKYVQQKIRADELEKRLRSKEARSSDKSDVPLERKSPILQSNTSFRIPSHKLHNESTNKVFAANDKGKELVKSSSASSSQEKLKICFSRNNQEVQLEGYWPQIHPALQQVVELLHTDDNPNVKSKQNPKQNTKPVYNKEESNVTSNEKKSEAMEIETVDIDSGKTTPIIPTIDPATHEKVSKIESEIFKEIEKRSKEEEPKLSETDNINTTKRGRGRPTKKSLSLSTPKTEKPATRHSRKSSKNEKLDVSTSKQEQKDELTSKQEQKDELTSKQEQKDDLTSKQEQKDELTSKQEQKDELTSKQEQKDELPSKEVQKEESTTKLDQKEESFSKELRKRDAPISKQVEKSNETVPKSDDAVMKRSSRAPKRLAEEEPEQRRMSTRRSHSRKSERLDDDEIRYKLPPNKKDTKPTVTTKKSSQSNPEDLSLRSIESTQGYQDSDASPVLLTKRRRKPSFKVHKSKKHGKRISLPNLTELLSSDSSNSAYFIPLRKSHSTLSSTVYKTDSYDLLMPKEKTLTVLDPINEDQNSDDLRHFNAVTKDEENRSSSSNIMIEIGSSSNVSLPPSPELSVVENLTLSREMIKPNISLNETELNKMDCRNARNENSKYDKYMISNIDVSCPLMEQECGLQNANENSKKKLVYKSLIDKEATVTMKEKSISETINKKLHDLLLESAKKTSNEVEKMDVDETVKKAKPKKRSSTPRKRKTAKNIKQAQVNSLLEEEHMEICSYAGRTSCPPVITVIPPDENANFAKTPADKKTKKKKDVIKVKIQRPKSRTREKSVSKNSTKTSITDSGINDPENFSGMFLKGNDSVDLIHNHSDTCLNVNECIGDSIQFIDNSVKSVISLNSTSSDSELKILMESADKSMDTFSNDAQDISPFTKLPNLVDEIFRSPSATFPSPAVTNSSLITEDLSNSPPPPTKWYLLSEDDTNTQVQAVRSFGSNLNQIFTACAVPNLSTITERSVDSRKVKDGDSQHCDSQSLF